MPSQYNSITISGSLAITASAKTILFPYDTLISGQLLDISITRPGIPAWSSGVLAMVGNVYSYSGKLYATIQSHTTQIDWTPDIAFSLFILYRPPDTISEWVQPLGSFDAYISGSEVTHNGYTWQSNINANVWEPGAVGSDTLWTNLTPPVTPYWGIGIAYKVGDTVIYQPNGFTYKCLQAHTSISTWTPPLTPSLWQQI